MQLYVVYRHEGSDAASGQLGMRPVARVEADSPEDACRQVSGIVTLTGGQFLSARPADEADTHEHDLNRTARTPPS